MLVLVGVVAVVLGGEVVMAGRLGEGSGALRAEDGGRDPARSASLQESVGMSWLVKGTRPRAWRVCTSRKMRQYRYSMSAVGK